ncbi:type III secretion system export apparatus subunit SctT [Massilia oculi]|jgi:type III secretion protein T|uniref:EscT/YscT/HrcT family type III secretion system export apparatus protein n=1 Tax=Massilia oculi TaxID=945844 RepID=A0A2S2DDV9_9BURK|nr:MULTISPECIES: type III secretion system export apparatus subunit SctT [Massilia]AWL03528.1 EscT/YscT/HrcT family type III secretion system export apparatus protein [Massilia oculi]MDY0977285.1 type III secretion system export apparatus subunit SctT [Massilia sp. CFBP9012]
MLIDLHHLLLAVALTLPRTAVVLAILPGFGAGTLGVMLRAAVAFGMSLPAMLPAYHFVRDHHAGVMLLTALGIKEALIGLVLGILLAAPMWALQSVGSIVDMQRSPIQIQNGNASIDRDASALGGLILQAMVVMMIHAGLLAALARVVLDSYAAWPVGSLGPPFGDVPQAVLVNRFAELMWHIVVYGAPIILVLVLIDLGMAVIGAFAPNLQVSFAASPIKSLAGMFVLLVYWSTLSHYASGDFARALDLIPSLLAGSTGR